MPEYSWSPIYNREHYGYPNEYYWSINPYSSGDEWWKYCMANCTCYAYGRCIENGLPEPITSYPSAYAWPNVVNTEGGWELLTYQQGMELNPGDLVIYSHQYNANERDNHVIVIEEKGTNPYTTDSAWSGDNHAGGGTTERTLQFWGGNKQTLSNRMIAWVPERFWRKVRLSNQYSNLSTPTYVIRNKYLNPDLEPDVPEKKKKKKFP